MSRQLLPIVALLVAACSSGPAPTTSPTLTGATEGPSERPSASLAGPTIQACVAGDDGTYTVEVRGTANIFGAGHALAPDPGGGGAGSLPPGCDLPPGATTVMFPAVTGEVTPYTGQPLRNGPAGDRMGAGGTDTDVTSHGGISGIINHGNGMFLVGVFLSHEEPADPAPERLDFTNAEDFEELAPQLAQTFLVGDGRGRTFIIPGGATRLFLGFADAFFYEGAPGWYGNNAGAFEVTIAVT